MRNFEKCNTCPVSPCFIEEENFPEGTSREVMLFACNCVRCAASKAWKEGYTTYDETSDVASHNPYQKHYNETGANNA